MARPRIPEGKKARNAGFAAYPEEIAALRAAACARRLKAPFDYVREAVIHADHPATRGKMRAPAPVGIQTPKPGRPPAPRTGRPQPPGTGSSTRKARNGAP